MLLKSLIKEECTFNNVRITQPLQHRVPAVPTKREYEALMHLFREKTHNYQQLGYHAGCTEIFSGTPVWTLPMTCWFGQDLGTVLAEQGRSCSYVQPRKGCGH